MTKFFSAAAPRPASSPFNFEPIKDHILPKNLSPHPLTTAQNFGDNYVTSTPNVYNPTSANPLKLLPQLNPMGALAKLSKAVFKNPYRVNSSGNVVVDNKKQLESVLLSLKFARNRWLKMKQKTSGDPALPVPPSVTVIKVDLPSRLAGYFNFDNGSLGDFFNRLRNHLSGYENVFNNKLQRGDTSGITFKAQESSLIRYAFEHCIANIINYEAKFLAQRNPKQLTKTVNSFNKDITKPFNPKIKGQKKINTIFDDKAVAKYNAQAKSAIKKTFKTPQKALKAVEKLARKFEGHINRKLNPAYHFILVFENPDNKIGNQRYLKQHAYYKAVKNYLGSLNKGSNSYNALKFELEVVYDILNKSYQYAKKKLRGNLNDMSYETRKRHMDTINGIFNKNPLSPYIRVKTENEYNRMKPEKYRDRNGGGVGDRF